MACLSKRFEHARAHTHTPYVINDKDDLYTEHIFSHTSFIVLQKYILRQSVVVFITLHILNHCNYGEIYINMHLTTHKSGPSWILNDCLIIEHRPS